jgi:hypothetical protein
VLSVRFLWGLHTLPVGTEYVGKYLHSVPDGTGAGVRHTFSTNIVSLTGHRKTVIAYLFHIPKGFVPHPPPAGAKPEAIPKNANDANGRNFFVSYPADVRPCLTGYCGDCYCRINKFSKQVSGLTSKQVPALVLLRLGLRQHYATGNSIVDRFINYILYPFADI